MFADLHIHSWYSDGTLSPEEIVQKAKAQNMTLISVCDHERIDAYPELYNLCDENNIKIVTGAEISAVIGDEDCHILAYNFNAQDKALNDLLRHNQSIFLDKGAELIEKMSVDYSNISMEEYSKYERDRRNGGWKSIDYLKSKGIVGSAADYFELVRKYHSPPDEDFLHPSEVIKTIHGAGGYAVLAHPCDNTEAADKFLNINIDGFECYYPAHTEQETEFYVKFCRGHDLIITAGGDEHGNFGEPGVGIGVIKIKTEQLNLKNMI
ncbi:MAG: PHP domain-containing protein [Oscillospiraceae bacterium]|nr:PHP domain-containing protein [Oscillospiraceae bacterium]